MCFSDAVADASTRFEIGYGFIVLSLSNIVVNLAIMLAQSANKLKLIARKRINLCKYRKRLQKELKLKKKVALEKQNNRINTS